MQQALMPCLLLIPSNFSTFNGSKEELLKSFSNKVNSKTMSTKAAILNDGSTKTMSEGSWNQTKIKEEFISCTFQMI